MTGCAGTNNKLKIASLCVRGHPLISFKEESEFQVEKLILEPGGKNVLLVTHHSRLQTGRWRTDCDVSKKSAYSSLTD